jgi:Lrp/AsnC family leucine-responsive transcriptional regulator
MDIIDAKILEALQENSRISLKAIGDKINLSSPSISERIKRMENEGIITKYTTEVDPAKLDITYSALINVSMRARHHQEFYKLIRASKNVVDCYHVTGQYCMVLKAHFRNAKDLEHLINQIQEFGETNTSIILSTPLKRNLFDFNLD